MYSGTDSLDDAMDVAMRTPSLCVSTTPEKTKENEENGFGSPMSPFLQTAHAPTGPSRNTPRLIGSSSRSSISRAQVSFLPVSDIPLSGAWEPDLDDDNDSEVPLTRSSSISRTTDAIPHRSFTRTTDFLLKPSYGSDDAPQLSARSEPNFRLHALCPSSPEPLDSPLLHAYDLMTDASSALGYSPHSGAAADSETEDDFATQPDSQFHLNTSGNSFGLHNSRSTLGSSASLFASNGTNHSQQGFTLGSPTASFSRISPRESSASSRSKAGGMSLSQSSLDLGGISTSTLGSGYGSSTSFGHSSVGGYTSTNSSLTGASPSPSLTRNRRRDGPGSGSSAVSPGIRSLNNSAANISIAHPHQPLFSSGSSRTSARSFGSNGGDTQLAGVSSSSILSNSVSSSDGYASAATNDSSARSSIDIQFDPDERMSVDFSRHNFQHGARTLPSAFDYSAPFGSPSRLSAETLRESSPSPIAAFQLPSVASPNNLATPSSGRSRSRTFGASDRSSPNLMSPQSPLPTFSLGSPTLIPSSSARALSTSTLPEKSPTRPRGGGSGAAFAARTQSFLSNPHPSNRNRRESSSSSGSRPRPRPAGLQQSGSDIELPKSMTAANVHGLIPNLSVNVVPPSPSRPQSRLPCFNLRKNDVTNRITAGTLVSLINGDFHHKIDEFFIIDCRSDYEFTGGHIRGAMHSSDSSVAVKLFITDKLEELRSSAANVALIFHCEYSEKRAPAAIAAFRDVEREYNEWPQLFYHDVYCLDGGYSKFFVAHPELCEGGYVKEGKAPNMRKTQSVSRICFSQSTPMLPTHNPETGEYEQLSGEEMPATRPRSATDDFSSSEQFTDSGANMDFSSSEQYADDEDEE